MEENILKGLSTVVCLTHKRYAPTIHVQVENEQYIIQ